MSEKMAATIVHWNFVTLKELCISRKLSNIGADSDSHLSLGVLPIVK